MIEVSRKETSIEEKVAELVRLTEDAAVVKHRIEELKAWFTHLATGQLQDTKSKTVEYWGDGAEKVTVGASETVKPVSMTMLRKLLGPAYPDFVKEETSYKMTEPAKRLFSVMAMGNYTESSIDETIQAITDDKKLQKTLRKKLKGKYEKDTETLMLLAGLSKEEASDYAYLTAEVLNWEWILQVLRASEWSGSPEEAVDLVKAAVIVEEGIKVTVESKE